MTSGGTLRGDMGPGAGAPEGVAGVVLVAHGGQEASTGPTGPLQPAVLRMIPIAAAIRSALRGSEVEVRRPRFRVRGWNGAQASPVGDLKEELDALTACGPVPVVLVGHSMGARAALRAAGHPAVSAVAGLAPWLPLGEPVGQLTGRRVLVAHGTADRVTSPADTWAYVARAREVTQVAAIEIKDGDHPMLRRASLWHAIAAEFARSALGVPAGNQALDSALRADSAGPPRVVLLSAPCRSRLRSTTAGRVPESAEGASAAVSYARLPRAVGDTIVASEPLRHGLGNAATGGIWRVHGMAGSAVLKVARLPAAGEPARAFPTRDKPDHWNYWRREALAYRTSLAATAYADAGIAASTAPDDPSPASRYSHQPCNLPPASAL
jgi:pimeloyl-ACP methyl ester carboxylesterase